MAFLRLLRHLRQSGYALRYSIVRAWAKRK